MKRFLTFLVAMLLSLLPMNAIQPAFDGDDEDLEEIVLSKQQNGDIPTSLNSVFVSAHKTSSYIVINIFNYTGIVVASVFGNGIGGYFLSDVNPVSGSGIIMLDISSLPNGNYTLAIMVDQLYQGQYAK